MYVIIKLCYFKKKIKLPDVRREFPCSFPASLVLQSKSFSGLSVVARDDCGPRICDKHRIRASISISKTHLSHLLQRWFGLLAQVLKFCHTTRVSETFFRPGSRKGGFRKVFFFTKLF